MLTLLGQQLFPADYAWNQNIANAPVAANSAAIISHIGSAIGVHPDWGQDSSANGKSPLYGIPYNVVHGNSTAKISVVIDNYPGESDKVPVPIPAGAVIEGDFQNGPNPNGGGYNSGQRGDSHLIVWDADTNTAYELYGVTRPTDPKLFPNTSGVELAHNDGLWHAAQESVWHMSADSFRALGNTSADAAGLSILAGLVRPDEGLPTSAGGQGAINHALRFTLPSGDVSPQYTYPASHVVNVSSGATKLPLGSRLRLADTPAINAQINAMGPEAQIIAHAMQQYGLVLADIGSSMFVTGTSASQDANNAISLTWNMNDVQGLHGLTAGDFQVVNLTPVVTGLSATSGSAGGTIVINGQNFSGSAGHLAVFFGNTAATSVSFISDSQISAVVPSGAGTVNVTVQSGVNETDPNNPQDNVNAPIFGYGTSAISAVDKFSFSSQTISGANSSAAFSSPTVPSGNTDTLTIVVKDGSGNAIGGLANSAFNFALAGGTSAGTFGAVTESTTKGTYTTTFTGSTAGTASTLTVGVNGVTLNTQPTITVSPNAVSGANSSAAFSSPTVPSGNTDTLTIVVKDGSGNAIGGLANSAFNFALAGGTSAGTFGAVTESTTKGTYTTTFTGTTAGTASTLTVGVNGVTLSTQPTITVSPNAVSGANSSAAFSSPTVPSGNTDTLTIVVKDGSGTAISRLANSAFNFALAGGTSAGTFGTVTESTTKGTYTTTFTGTTAGTASTLTVGVNGVTLSTQPPITVTANVVSGANSSVIFATSTILSGKTDLLTITVKDGSGNAISGLGDSAFNFGLSGGTSAGKFGTVTETATKGTYTALFTGTTAGTRSTLNMTINGVSVDTRPTVEVNRVTAPKITSQPSSARVAPGQAATFTVAAKGTGPLHYQWEKRVGSVWVNVSSGNTSGFKGATSATLTILSAVATDAGRYRVVVSNATGIATSKTVRLTVSAARVAPMITLNPSSQAVTVGSFVTLSAAASGNPTPTVQWEMSSGGAAFVAIADAKSTTLSFTATANLDGNQYRAVFTNGAGIATTQVATLTVSTTGTPPGTTIARGQQLVVSAGQTVTGIHNLAGDLIVAAGGTDKATVNDSIETVAAGGKSIGATINQEADMEVFGTATGVIDNGGYLNADRGGTVIGTVMNEDILYVSAGATAINTTINSAASVTLIGGGTASGTVINGGTEWVRAGAVTNNPTVNSGGTEYVFAGGLANNLTPNAGSNATILGTVAGATINQGGTLTVFDGGSATGAIVDNGTLIFDGSATKAFAGQLTGNGALVVRGAGMLVVNSALNNNVAVTIGTSSSLELGAAANSNMTLGYQSKLKLDASQNFTGTIAGMAVGYQQQLDLGDVPFSKGVTSVQFVENAAHTQGTLTIRDAANGGPTVNLTLLGNYTQTVFTAQADGATGTAITIGAAASA